jgi:lipoprotein-anchoring transpeptidase ErfK/SrfK
MKTRKQLTVAVMVMGMSFAAQTEAQTAVQQQVDSTVAHKRLIVVSLEDRKLALIEDGQVKKIYTVAVGRPSTPSPVGTFTIERRVMNPTYSHNGQIVEPGPNNPVGTRWMGLSIHGYGIHGTNVPNSIGKASSHGCIRMAKADLEEFYPQVRVGDTVELIGRRDEETAQLFGNPAVPPTNAQTTKTELASAAQTPQISTSAAHEITSANTPAVGGAL